MAALADGIFSESEVNFVGKDGFFWWVGEVEDNEDPMELGRVKVRCLGYYTNFAGGTLADLPTASLPWATVLQHTSQAGNDGQGESSGQLQPGAIVLGFFMDGEMAQMPIVLGVMRVNKSDSTKSERKLSFTNQVLKKGEIVNNSAVHPAENDVVSPIGVLRQGGGNAVAHPGHTKYDTGGSGSPKNIGVEIPGGGANPIKPIDPEKPIPAANGIGSSWKSIEYKFSYLIEDLASSSNSLVKAEAGDYLDLVSGKLIKKKDLLAPLSNYLTVVYAQVISSVRQSLISLANDLKITTLMLKTDGTPFAVYNSVVKAITSILDQACKFDANLDGYVDHCLKPVEEQLDMYLSGVKSKEDLVKNGVNQVSKNILENVVDMIKKVGDLTDTVKKKVDGINDEVDLLLDHWVKGLDIFESTTTLFNQGQYEYVSINETFKLLGKFGAGCTRTAESASKLAGWYPLFGLTLCPLDELKDLNKIRGDVKKSTDLFSSVFRDADPYLTSAKNHINGSYDLWLGTPGRQADVSKRVNGTTHTSVSLNNAHFAEKVARDTFKKNNPDASQEQIDNAAMIYRREQNSGKGDTGSLVADHISYAGTLTREVHGDDCKLVTGSNALTVDGDYYLKITGNCHLEVGGGFFLSAEGAPKKGGKIQKHAIKFGSDVDMSVVGAKLHFQSSELDLSATKTRITGRYFENTSDSQTYSGLEITLQSQNSIQVVTPHLLELIGVENTGTKKLRGKRSITVGGNELKHYHTNQTTLYSGYSISLASNRKLYNDAMTDGVLKEDLGNTALRYETTS